MKPLSLSTLHSPLSTFFLVWMTLLMTSCIREELYMPYPEPANPVQNGYIKIHLNTPDPQMPTSKSFGTRAMRVQTESAIDAKMLNVLVFSYKDDGDGNITEIFDYVASVKGGVVYDEMDVNKATVVAKLLKSSTSNEYCRIVVIANHVLSGVDLVRNVTTKKDLLEQLTYPVPEKWNTAVLPMWGESMPIVITDDMPSPTIELCRALARIDVGLNFKSDNGKLTDQAYGIAGFKLAEVLVYRTYNKGYVAPNGDTSETPSMPPNALRHGDDSPLGYIIPDVGGVDVYAREIYVPEAELPSAPNKDNIHCIVIGGYYQSSTVVSYYRIDFAIETTPGKRSYLPLLRNHRYVFNIIQVHGPGFSSAMDALASMATTGNVDYDLVVWDATIHEMETQGRYYFGIDNRDLLAEAPSTNAEPNNKFTVRYQTNCPLSVSNPLRFAWASVVNNPFSSPIFDVQWQPTGRNILITVLNENLTNALLTDTLYVYAGPFVKKIVVKQKCYDVKYTVDCSSIVVKGLFKRGITLNPSEHYITLSIIADNRGMQGRSFIIETTDPYNHGIRFRAEDSFDFTGIPEGEPLRINNIRLNGSGTLHANSLVRRFSLPLISSSPSALSCETTIQLVIPHMHILVLADPDITFGYSIANTSGGAGKIFNSPNNFGPNENSMLKVEGFTYISSPSDNIVTFTGDLHKWITGIGNDGKIADVVYIADYTTFTNNTTVSLLVDYMEKGGVVVIFNEENTVTNFINAALGVNTISVTEHGRSGSVYPFPANPVFGLDANGVQEVLHRYEADPIMNGPFGDVRDKQWGSDINRIVTLSGLPQSSGLTAYSYEADIATNNPAVNINNVTGFKYESENCNMVWFGDAGFMTSQNGSIGTSKASCPLGWDTNTYFPEIRTGYGHTKQMPVYNSVVFCNIMAWAIEKSDNLRGKRKSYEVNQ